MKAIAENHALNFHAPDAPQGAHVDTLLLAKIGYDLREIYGNVAEAEQPDDLLALAAAVDERIAGDSSGE